MRHLAFFFLSVILTGQSIDYGDIKNTPTVAINAADYKFTRTNGSGASGDLSSAGSSKSVTVNTCPKGINGTNVSHYLYLSGGVGTEESVLITGGTCTSNAASGTLVFTTSNTHTSNWVLSSASGGIQEAICALPSGGGSADISENITLYANVATCGKTNVMLNKVAGSAISGAYTIFGATSTGRSYHEKFFPETSDGPIPVGANKTYEHDAGYTYSGGTYFSLLRNVDNVSEDYIFSNDPGFLMNRVAISGWIKAYQAGHQGDSGISGVAQVEQDGAGVAVHGFCKGDPSATNSSYCFGANLIANNGGAPMAGVAPLELDTYITGSAPGWGIGLSNVSYAKAMPAGSYDAYWASAGSTGLGYLPWKVGFHSVSGAVCTNCPAVQIDESPAGGANADSATILFQSLNNISAPQQASLQFRSGRYLELANTVLVQPYSGNASASGTYEFNLSSADTFLLVLSGNITSSTITGGRPSGGGIYHVIIVPGTYTWAWPANVTGAMTIQASKKNVQTFWWDGTTLWALDAGHSY